MFSLGFLLNGFGVGFCVLNCVGLVGLVCCCCFFGTSWFWGSGVWLGFVGGWVLVVCCCGLLNCWMNFSIRLGFRDWFLVGLFLVRVLFGF